MRERIVHVSAGRAVLILLLLVGALILVARHSFASVIVKRNPELVLQIVPGHADASALIALRSMSDPARTGDVDRAIALGKSALQHEPLSAVAAGGLGLANDRAGKAALAAGQLAFSERLSRRELVVQLWLIENAVRQDDIPGALRHYDIAMRTSRDALGILFPILIGAIEDPAVLDPLADVLAKRPVWSDQFIQQLAQSGTAFDSLTRLYRALRQRGSPVPDLALATATGRMVERGDIEAAWRLFAGYRPGAARAGLRNGTFEAPLADGTPFDWRTGPGGEIVVEQRAALDGTALYFETPMGVGGVAARQLLLLPPGRVQFAATASEIAGGGASLPYLRLVCGDNARELGRQMLQPSETGGVSVSFEAEVPANCPAQWLEIVAQATDSVGGASGYIDNIRLSR